MNKECFLKDLQNRLAVLEVSEQQDILEEYAQHIDMRVEGGLTEEEAIRDFGDPDQLVALLLEAYHVNPDYQKTAVPASSGSGEENLIPPAGSGTGAVKLREWAARTGRAVGGFFQKIGGGLTAAGHRIAAFFRSLWTRITALFHRPAKVRTERANSGTAVKRERSPFLPAVRKTAGTVGQGLLRFCQTLLRLAWNLLLLLCALPLVGLALAGLVALGILTVLLVQGYPLMGPFLICVGGMLFCGALLCLGYGFILRKGESHHENS